MTEALERNIGKVRESLDDLKEDYGVARIGLFGSVTRDDFSPESDIDVLVEFDRAPGMFGFVRLERRLSELLGRRVDLVSAAAVKPAIRDEVINSTVYV